jgi:serine/threonine protein kinase
MKYCPLCGKNYGDETEFCDVDGAILRISGKKDPYLGNVIKGRYQVLSKLGEGGMGTVYLAEQVSVGRKVAIKFLLGNYATDDAFISRFRREARLAASLNHRNIVILYDFDQANDGTLFIVMEYLSGQKLSDVIRRDGPLEIGRAARLGLQIADGLDAAHRAGVIHRDIKPDNIMVAGADASEEIKLMDFGIARLRDPGNASQITRAGLIVGTPAYMAPEQVDGGEVSDKTDTYALGVVLYEMLSGSVPFTAATPGAVLIKQMQEMPVPLRKLRRELPAAVERAVMQALEKEPQKRQANMAEVVQQLRKAEEQLRGKPGIRVKEPGSGWDRIGQAFRKADEKRPVRFEPPPEQLPIEPTNARTILESAGPQWAPTQAISFDDFDVPKPRGSTFRRTLTMLALLAVAGVVGTVFYLKSGPSLISNSFTPKETSIAPTSPELVSLSVTLDKRNLAPKERMTLTATGRFSDGSQQEISSGLKWHSSNSSVISINSEGQAEGQNEGVAELSAEFKEQVSPPVTLVVKTDRPTTPARAPAPVPTPSPVPTPVPTLRSLIVVSVKRELQANERMVLRAKGQYSDGKEVDVNDGIVWQSSDERIASIDSKGRLTAHRSGQVKLNATYEGVASPAISLIVKDPISPEPQLPTEPRQKPPTEKPRAPEIRENLRNASIFYEEGKYSEAMIELEHALRLDPESKDARSQRIKVMKAWEAEKKLTPKTP